jgi:hypothetical protein
MLDFGTQYAHLTFLSRGGKVAMAIALDPYLDTHENLLENLIAVDIAPTKAGISQEFRGYIEAMQRIEKEKIKTRKEATELLSEYEKAGTSFSCTRSSAKLVG